MTRRSCCRHARRLINTDGTGLRQLDTDPAGVAVEALSWSPDGMLVLAESPNRTGLVVLKADWPPGQLLVDAGVVTATTDTSGFDQRASWQRLAP